MSIYGKDIADTSRTMRAGQRSAVDTGALVGAHYLGFVYEAGMFANGIPLVRIVALSEKWPSSFQLLLTDRCAHRREREVIRVALRANVQTRTINYRRKGIGARLR